MKQNDLLLTEEEIGRARLVTCRECKEKSPRNYKNCFTSHCIKTDIGVTKDQLAKVLDRKIERSKLEKAIRFLIYSWENEDTRSGGRDPSKLAKDITDLVSDYAFKVKDWEKIEEAKREERSETLKEVGEKLSKESIHSTFDTKCLEECYLIKCKDWESIKE